MCRIGITFGIANILFYIFIFFLGGGGVEREGVGLTFPIFFGAKQ